MLSIGLESARLGKAHGYEKEKLEPVLRQSDQSAVVEAFGNMTMAICLFFEIDGSEKYEFSNCPSFARFFE
jgi:hypothetical protein